MLSKMIKHQHTNTENSQALKWELLERCGPQTSPFRLLVYTVFGSVKSSVSVAEFKPSNQNSYVESGLVNLASKWKWWWINWFQLVLLSQRFAAFFVKVIVCVHMSWILLSPNSTEWFVLPMWRSSKILTKFPSYLKYFHIYCFCIKFV